MQMRNITYNPEGMLAILKRSGHDYLSALCDLTDNSIDAGANYLSLTITADKFDIFDNGSGLDMEDAIKSMEMGRSDKRAGKLGKYGIGLKQSPLVIGAKCEINSKKNGGYVSIHYKEENIGEGKYGIEEKPSDDFLEQKIRAANARMMITGECGTLVNIFDLRDSVPKIPADAVESIKNRFGVIYRKMLQKKAITILINGEEVVAIDPINDEKDKVLYPLQKLKTKSGKEFTLELVQMKKRDKGEAHQRGLTAENSGIHFVRCDREIVKLPFFGRKVHSTLSYLRAEVCFNETLDDMIPPTIDKTKIDNINKEIVTTIQEAIDVLVSKAAAMFGKKEKNKNKKTHSYKWGKFKTPEKTSGDKKAILKLYNSFAKSLHSEMKKRSKNSDDSVMTEMEIAELLAESDCCALTGLPIYIPVGKYSNKDKQPINIASPDRIDSSKGYVKGNVQIVIRPMNLMKNTMSDNLAKTIIAAVKKGSI